MTRIMIDADAVPRLAAHMRLRQDKARGQWTIQAPERSFVLDDIAHAIVTRCDGIASVAAIVADLCTDFPDAPPDAVYHDVAALLQDLADKGIVTA
jgi:pyrroloquinoline quinone biosynthesis protein D